MRGIYLKKLENHEAPGGLCDVPVKIRTEKLSDTRPERCSCDNLLGPFLTYHISGGEAPKILKFITNNALF
jgi:hypothetical protein